MSKEKVLIVEDEMDLLDLIDFNLTRKGFITSGSFDGLDAVSKLDSFDPDIVILDLMLPKLSGWEICKTIKERKQDIPVIMTTAKCMPEDRVMGFEAGADDYMTKPFDIKELVIRINNLLEKRRNKDLQSFLYHEMKNGVYAISCYSELLSRKGEALGIEKKTNYLRNINKQVNYTTELIAGMEAFMDTGACGYNFKTERCDIKVILKELTESYRTIAENNGVTITLAATDVPEVLANGLSVRQVFMNLIGNAVKYCKKNGFVEVSAKVCGDGISVSVKDDGCGIPADDLPLIFEKGFRATNARNTVHGSGLGLYIVRILLEKMGARISVESAEGKGSEFSVVFNANPSPALA